MLHFLNISLFFAMLGVFSFTTPLCLAGVEKYSATVEDGTARVIRPGKKAASEPTEEYLENIAPAAPAPKKLRAPGKVTAHSKSENTVSDAAELRRERGGYKQRVDELEQAEEDMVALYPQDGVEMTADEAVEGPDASAVERAEEEQVADETVAPAAPVIESRVAEKAVVRADVAKKQKAQSFDTVPDKRITEIAQRLKYANEILKRWGRAYDYRSVTLSQFKKIVAELEAIDEKTQSVN